MEACAVVHNVGEPIAMDDDGDPPESHPVAGAARTLSPALSFPEGDCLLFGLTPSEVNGWVEACAVDDNGGEPIAMDDDSDPPETPPPPPPPEEPPPPDLQLAGSDSEVDDLTEGEAAGPSTTLQRWAARWQPPSSAKVRYVHDTPRKRQVRFDGFTMGDDCLSPYQDTVEHHIHLTGHFFEDTQARVANKGGVALYPGRGVAVTITDTQGPHRAYYFYHVVPPPEVDKGRKPYAVLGVPGQGHRVDTESDTPTAPWHFFLQPIFQSARNKLTKRTEVTLTLQEGVADVDAKDTGPDHLSAPMVQALSGVAHAFCATLLEGYFGWRALARLPLRAPQTDARGDAAAYMEEALKGKQSPFWGGYRESGFDLPSANAHQLLLSYRNDTVIELYRSAIIEAQTALARVETKRKVHTPLTPDLRYSHHSPPWAVQRSEEAEEQVTPQNKRRSKATGKRAKRRTTGSANDNTDCEASEDEAPPSARSHKRMKERVAMLTAQVASLEVTSCARALVCHPPLNTTPGAST